MVNYTLPTEKYLNDKEEILNFNFVEEEDVVYLSPVEKTSRAKTAYSDMPITHRSREFLIQGPPLRSGKGVQKKAVTDKDGNIKVDDKGREQYTYSLQTHYDNDNKNHQAWCEMLTDKVYKRCLDGISEHGIALRKKTIKRSAADDILGSPVYTPIDKKTGEDDPTRAKSSWLKLRNTLFTTPGGMTIPQKDLINKELEFIPVVHVMKIFWSSGNKSIQMYLRQAIILSVRGRNTISEQKETAKALIENNPELDNQVLEQLAAIREGNKNSVPNAIPKPDASLLGGEDDGDKKGDSGDETNDTGDLMSQE